MDLIDRSKLKRTEGMFQYRINDAFDRLSASAYTFEDVENAPTVDAVEVVRCKDCKWWKTNYMWNGSERKVCVIEPYEPVRNEGDYCSRGERKENEIR